MNIGFIGCGNMARPIIKGIIKNAKDVFNNVYVYDILADELQDFCNKTGAIAAKDKSHLISLSDVLVLATKPQIFSNLLPEIDEGLKLKNPLIISIAAGKTLAFIESKLSFDARVARVFPNLNAEVFESVSAYCLNKNSGENEEKILEGFCKAFGTAIPMLESLFSAFGVLSGCSPAYTFLYIDSLAKAGIEHGIDEKTALEAALRVCFGSALTLLETGKTPKELIDRVCSPNGTTIEGINQLKNNGFEDIIKGAFKASYERDKQL